MENGPQARQEKAGGEKIASRRGLTRDAVVASICGFVVVLMVGASYAAVPSRVCGAFSISITFPDYIFSDYMGRTRTPGPLTMVTAKNSTTSTPSASAIATER